VKDAMLMRLESGGATAWSECVSDPDPFYSYETNTTARHIIAEFLLPLVEPGITLGELETRFGHVRGHRMAKATIENALLILIAEQQGVPLHALLGRPAVPIPSGLSIGLQDSPDALLRIVDRAVERKYHRVKMKIKQGQDVAWVRAVRDRFPGLPLMVDANGDYTLDDAAHLAELDAFDLTMVEQPLSYTDIIEHATLQRSLKTPLCLDESIHTLADAAAAISIGGVPDHQHQAGARRRPARVDADRAPLRRARRRRVVGRHGRDRHRPRRQHPPADRRGVHDSRRHRRDGQLLPRRPSSTRPSCCAPTATSTCRPARASARALSPTAC
jgi:o-succinylbenzoate synthase